MEKSFLVPAFSISKPTKILKVPTWIFPAFLIFAFLGSISESNSQEDDVSKLFRTEEILDIRLGFSFKDVKKSDKETSVSQEWLYYKDNSGEWDSLKVELFARGNFRKDHCFFTPLKIKIDKKRELTTSNLCMLTKTLTQSDLK